MINEKTDQAERLKVLIDKALLSGRAFQSSQTGFVHYYNSLPVPAIHQTIPLYENGLFVLALLRSRLVENMNEAKELLDKLLNFQAIQGQAEGNFPFYVHEYPFCYDSEVGVRLIAPFYWILKQFGHVLGLDLKQKLEKRLANLVRYGIRTHAEHPFPYSLAARLAAGLQACGGLLKNQEWLEKGISLWKELSQPSISWYATVYLADLLIAHQMVGMQDSDWKSFWSFVNGSWHPQLSCYIGPCVREWQNKDEPQANLYDLFMGFFCGHFSHRVEALGIYHLQGSLIQSQIPAGIESQCSHQLSGLYKEQMWQLAGDSTQAYALLEKKGHAGPIGEKTITPFRLAWGAPERLHTLVCQGGKYSQASYQTHEAGRCLELFFYFGEESEKEEKDRQRDICFYWDDHPDWQVRVEGEMSNTFEFGKELSFSFDNGKTLLMTFELAEGEGQFFGHIARGNRPSQLKLISEEKHFQAYDALLFVRTVRRKTPCLIKATLKFT